MLRNVLSALAVGAALVAVSDAHAAPLAFQHSGRLLDTMGVPLNQEITLTVSLSATEGGIAFWSQQFVNLPVEDGYFAVEVGPGSPALTTDDLDRAEVWLTTSFPGVSSSQRLLMVPYAARAEVADAVVGHGAVVQMAAVQSRTLATYTSPTSGTGTAITPLDIVMTPRKAGNHVVLEWTVSGEINHDSVWTVTRNGALLAQATNGSNNRWAGTSQSSYDNNDSSTGDVYVVRIIDTNTLATETTYRVHTRAAGSIVHTFYFNRTVGGSGSDNQETGLSVGTATEIWQTP